MEIWINLEFGDGNFECGFAKINLNVTVANGQENITQQEVQLPPNTEISDSYQRWKEQYYSLLNHSRGGFKNNQVTHISKIDCHSSAQGLCRHLHQWLHPIQSQLEQALSQDSQPEIRLFIHTEKITCLTTKDILHRLPWQEWGFFAQKFFCEAAVCFHSFVASTATSKKLSTSGKIRRARIISIFGDSTDIDISGDKKLLEKLKKRSAELIILTEPTRSDFNMLWEEACDILFFAGHSETKGEGQTGIININPNDSLSLAEIKRTLKAAINKGLKLAIFNSCDGLGLAKQLADLNLPYIIVWREVVPDKLAQKFLQYFLSSFSKGESLFNSVRQARDKLKELANDKDIEKRLPGVSWLPIICKNTTELAPSWEDLGGLSGELPLSPYQGLSAFQKENADYFFGREKFIAKLVEAANSNPLVPVIGASGSGKSSVVFAGLIPRLQATENAEIINFRPGKNPFDAMAVALSKYCQSAVLEFEVNLRHDETVLCRLIENIVNSLGYQRLVLVADQFEELYTLAAQEERHSFLRSLLLAVTYARSFTLVLTLRADFLGIVLDEQSMGKALQQYPPLLLTAMDREELRDAIEKPALKMKVELEEGLTSKLINDVGDRPGRLPLLEFALTQLWSKQKNWYLTHQAYEEIGGLEKALAKHASEVLKLLSAVKEQQAERVFIQLVRPGEGTEDTRRVATRNEVREENWGLVKHLADERLVVTGWDEVNEIETVEIVHEALIREWGTLREWITANREFRIWQERFKEDVRDWENSNQNPEALLQGTRLAVAEDWYNHRGDELTPRARDFITASITWRKQEQQKQRHRRQLTTFGLTGVSLVALMLAGAAWWQSQNAQLNEIKAISVSSKALLTLEQDFEALIESLRASRKLKETPSVLIFHRFQEKADIQKQIDILLQNALYKVTERNRLEKHKDEVTDVSFSPDGKIIATASKDKTVKLWSLDGAQIQTLKGHKDWVRSVRFSSTGKTIATASWDGTVKLWTTEGKLMTTLTGHNTKVYSVSFSPDGKTIASADAKGYVKVWTLEGKFIKTFKAHDQPVLSLSFSPDGNTLATASQDKTVKLWSRNEKLLRTLTGHKDWVWSVSFSPDSQKIATASRDETGKLWSIEGKEIKTLKDDKNSVTSVSFSPDGKQIVTVGADQTIKIWDESGQKLQTLMSGHKDWIWSVSFSPDGKMMATASKDGTAKLWQLKGKKHYIQQAHNVAIYCVSFSPDEKEYATASKDKTVKLWKRSGELIKTLKLDNSSNDTWFTHISFSPNGQRIATATQDGTVILWNRQGEKIKTFQGHNKKWIWQVSFSPDGNTLATAGHDGIVKFWNLDGKLIQSIKAHTKGKNEDGEGANSVSFSPDGKIIATAGWDKTVKLWTREGKLIKTLRQHQDGVHSVSFSPNGKMIASASEDRTVKLWTLEGKLITTLKGHEAGVFRVKFSPDSKTIATGSLDKTVKLWSLDGKELKTYKGHGDSVMSLNFSRDGNHLISADKAGKIIIWDLGLDSNQLLIDGCNWVGDYLKNNPQVSESDRTLCQGIGIQK
ncbi:MAG: CHAT domain-containing protein [Cyanomargarita calcarea GSE-NOS-MK-12-04C]|jgi:WD40 repeat protein|uniref:CHAT domain-containing protein n=1 Tax=Cyanomargarita calcarea GSE-NOS-MK-12-04C TaxID=2839659 RepID=A0A951QRF8_9CYAN|nr:CHAT domain-containing protein [Cyanomargarita calcarea GSE-NOS-MK-12-04C]